MVYYDPRKPKPWPIRLLNSWGVVNDTKATNIAIAVALAGILLTIVLYTQILNNDADVEELDPRVLQEMERVR